MGPHTLTVQVINKVGDALTMGEINDLAAECWGVSNTREFGPVKPYRGPADGEHPQMILWLAAPSWYKVFDIFYMKDGMSVGDCVPFSSFEEDFKEKLNLSEDSILPDFMKDADKEAISTKASEPYVRFLTFLDTRGYRLKFKAIETSEPDSYGRPPVKAVTSKKIVPDTTSLN